MRSLTTDAKDVSEEYYDVEARIRNKQKTEARLLELLEKAAANLDQVLAVEEKLDRVREEIERMQGRLRVLADLADLATVTITVEEIVLALIVSAAARIQRRKKSKEPPDAPVAAEVVDS